MNSSSLRILFISAFYPPHVIGGWEQLVSDINQRLQQRGHRTFVLTSRHGLAGPAPQEPGVARLLDLDAPLENYRPLDFFLRRKQIVAGNLRATRAVLAAFKPDVIFVHGMWNLTRAVPWLAEQMHPQRVVYYMANDWPYAPDTHAAFWKSPANGALARRLKNLAAPLALGQHRRHQAQYPLAFKRVLTVSEAVRQALAQQAGIPLANMQVVYNGVETDLFTPGNRQPAAGELRLLYAGSLAAHKGVHTAVAAMELLAARPGMEQVSLTLVGSGHPAYEAHLKERVTQAGLENRVRFEPRVDRQAMPALMRQFDALVFPSTWEEPLARMTQEAMASGLVVVGTLTGGTPEILKPAETGLAFAAGDARDLAQQIETLAFQPELRRRLAQNARQWVVGKFELERMIDEIEAELRSTNERAAQSVGPSIPLTISAGFSS